ncbi:MAG TPA: SCO family protein [Kiloniellales bacterium]|jgi:protein SCO1/2
MSGPQIRHMSRLFPFLGAILLIAGSMQAAAETRAPAPEPFDQGAAIAYSQAAIGRPLDDRGFLDTQRRPIRLSDYRGKPLVVNLVFTACSDSCPIVVQTLRNAVDVAQDAVGKDAFSVVTIGFDAGDDTPERMRAFARGQGVDLPNWDFLSGEAAAIEGLVENLGFIYFPSPRGYDHLAQTTVIDAEGIIYRQVYGSQFTAPALTEPLIELIFGRASSSSNTLEYLTNRLRLFCTYYDPNRDRYRFDYAIFIGLIVGASSLIGIGTILVRAWLRTRPNAHSV